MESGRIIGALSAEQVASYRPNDPIKITDTKAAKLTLEQVAVLVNWADWQNCSTFEDKDGNSFPLQAILDLFHASIVYDTFDSWHEEEPKAARKAYIAICRKHKIAHGAVA